VEGRYTHLGNIVGGCLWRNSAKLRLNERTTAVLTCFADGRIGFLTSPFVSDSMETFKKHCATLIRGVAICNLYLLIVVELYLSVLI